MCKEQFYYTDKRDWTYFRRSLGMGCSTFKNMLTTSARFAFLEKQWEKLELLHAGQTLK